MLFYVGEGARGWLHSSSSWDVLRSIDLRRLLFQSTECPSCFLPELLSGCTVSQHCSGWWLNLHFLYLLQAIKERLINVIYFLTNDTSNKWKDSSTLGYLQTPEEQYSGCVSLLEINNWKDKLFFFSFLWPHLLHCATATAMLAPSCLCDLQAACGNARSLTHCATPGIEPESSWILVHRFLTCWATMGRPASNFFTAEE